MSTVNAAEVVDVLVRRGGRPDEVARRVEELFDNVVTAISPSVDDGLRAGDIRAQLFPRRSRRLSLADCFVLATVESGDSIVTTDETLAAAARNEGIDVVMLPS
jgi:predicted nucleic acid-binding protein